MSVAYAGYGVWPFNRPDREPIAVFHGDNAQELARNYASLVGGALVSPVTCITSNRSDEVLRSVSNYEEVIATLERKVEDAEHNLELERLGREDVRKEHLAIHTMYTRQIAALLRAVNAVPSQGFSHQHIVDSVAERRFYDEKYVHELEVALGLEGFPEVAIERLRRRCIIAGGNYAIRPHDGKVATP